MDAEKIDKATELNEKVRFVYILLKKRKKLESSKNTTKNLQ